MNIRSLVPELIKASLCIGLTVIATTTQAGGVTAWANIVTCDSKVDVIGKASLRERRSDDGVKLVDVFMRVKGLKPGKHAVHIHEKGSCKPGPKPDEIPCGDAKGHFDPGPFGAVIGSSSPDGNHPFHSGDLVNIKVNHRGRGILRTTTSRITLSPGPLTLFDVEDVDNGVERGSAFIIHVGKDTYCPDGNVKDCAGGARAACGIIYRN